MRLVESGLEPEARQALNYLRETLEIAGSSLDLVIKYTVFFTDMKGSQRFNEIYRTYFPHHMPARSSVEVQGLALGASVEIECTALAIKRAASCEETEALPLMPDALIEDLRISHVRDGGGGFLRP